MTVVPGSQWNAAVQSDIQADVPGQMLRYLKMQPAHDTSQSQSCSLLYCVMAPASISNRPNA